MMRVSLSLPEAIVEEVDARRGDVPRSRYVLRVLEKLLTNKERASRNLGRANELSADQLVREGRE